MKKDWAVLSGWAAGVFAASTVVLAVVIVDTQGSRASADLAQSILFFIILAAGPGLLILSAWISRRLKRRHASGATRGSSLALGTLVGATVGLPAVLLVPLIFVGADVLRSLSDPRQPEALLLIAMGVVSGATTGFTCAWRVSRPS